MLVKRNYVNVTTSHGRESEEGSKTIDGVLFW